MMEKTLGKLVVLLSVLVILYLIVAVIFSVFPFNMAAKVANTNKIISNYEWFYDSNSQIKAYKIQIENSENDLKNIDKKSDFYERKLIELDGIKKLRLNLIAEYNSKSKQITRNLWKAKELPYEINLEVEYEKK